MKHRRRRQKKCFYCGKSFKSKAQQKDKQYTCGNPKCIAARRRKASKHWRDKNPGFQASHGMNDEYRVWHRKWKKKYRRKNPAYVKRNNFYWKKWKLKQSPSYPVNKDSEVKLETYAP